MTGQQIINRFELQVDDLTELSSVEELAILNRVYKRVVAMMPWEILKKQASGTMSTDATGHYIDTPSDFMYFSENGLYTDNTTEWQANNTPSVIFVGADYSPIHIVNYADRRQHRNSSDRAYHSHSEDKIRITGTPVSTTYEFDYLYEPADLTTATEPVFPTRFHDMLAYGMAVENDILQLSEKARSYASENEARFKEDLNNMKYWNSKLRHD